jgi:hypothetical protein
MKKLLLIFALTLTANAQTDPSNGIWDHLLATHYDPARGMSYAALKGSDSAVLQQLRQQLARTNPDVLTPKQRLAYWINVYNVNTVATIVESYPLKSIRDLSTDPIVRLNVFKKDRVPVFGGGTISLDDVENVKIRNAFHDPRIHFAINCAAKSCPPMRAEAFTGAKVDAQLDDQVRRFVNSSFVRFSPSGDKLVIHTSKIMDWFADDFGDRAAFIRRYATPDKQRLIDQARKIELEFDDYDWSLNDAKR